MSSESAVKPTAYVAPRSHLAPHPSAPFRRSALCFSPSHLPVTMPIPAAEKDDEREGMWGRSRGFADRPAWRLRSLAPSMRNQFMRVRARYSTVNPVYFQLHARQRRVMPVRVARFNRRTGPSSLASRRNKPLLELRTVAWPRNRPRARCEGLLEYNCTLIAI